MPCMKQGIFFMYILILYTYLYYKIHESVFHNNMRIVIKCFTVQNKLCQNFSHRLNNRLCMTDSPYQQGCSPPSELKNQYSNLNSNHIMFSISEICFWLFADASLHFLFMSEFLNDITYPGDFLTQNLCLLKNAQCSFTLS